MAATSNEAASTQTGPAPPKFGGQAPSAIIERLFALYERIPTGPIGSGRGNIGPAVERGCWAVDEDLNGKVTVSVPSNLEAWADDPQAIAGVAALAAIPNVEIVLGNEWPINQHLASDSKSGVQYFSGVAHALRYAPTEDGSDYSGMFGHGVAFVTHHWAITHNLEPWLIKGSSKSMSQVLTRQAWATGLPVELRRLEALIRRAASSLPDGDWIAKWSKTSSQLAGHGIRQTIPYKKVGIVSQAEVDWISDHYRKAEEAYENLRHLLDNPKKTKRDLQRVPEENRRVAGFLRIPSDLHESVTRGRFSALNEGISRRDQARENRRPIGDRLRDLDVIQKLSVMHPLFLRGRRFVIHEDQITGLQARNPAITLGVRNQIIAFTRAEQDPVLRDLAETWFQDEIRVLAPEVAD
jgi:hypothetical protein